MKAAIRRALRAFGRDVVNLRHTPRQLLEHDRVRTLEFDDLMCRHMFEHGEACRFVQVGAFDGVSTDPLHRYIARCGWRGVLVEPQPGPAAALRALYADHDGITVIEAAVDRSEGRRSLFIVEGGDLPHWAAGMASFDRAHILKHADLLPDLARHIREIEVRCVTFDEVLDTLAADRLDLLQIDAEGFDHEIVALYPFERLAPAIVHFERKHLDRRAQEAALDRLVRFGYRVAPAGDEDMLAVRDPA